MKTDALFYELFKIDPRSLFRLVQIELEGEYIFESLTTKTTEKRFDGFCKRLDGIGPHVFLEVQGYPDPNIYWRLFREICTYYEQTETTTPFIAIVLFVDEQYDPGWCPLCCAPPCQMIRANLIDCLQAVSAAPGVLTILKPFLLSSVAEVAQHLGQWKADLQGLQLPEHLLNTVIGLLEYLIIERFPKISRKELETMLQLTPIEQTVIGQEVFQMGMKEGEKKGEKKGEKRGLRKGELIGEIRLKQLLLKRPVSSFNDLMNKSIRELEGMLRKISTELPSSST